MRIHSHTVGDRELFDNLLHVEVGSELEERFGPPWDPVAVDDVMIFHERDGGVGDTPTIDGCVAVKHPGNGMITGRMVEFDVVEAVNEPGYPSFQLAKLRRRA